MALDANEYPEQSVSKFESMLKTNDLYFFDTEDFEEITHHYLSIGKVALAQKAVQIGLEQHPHATELKLLQVEILAFEKKYKAAESLLEELQNLEAYNEEIYIQRANIQSKQKNHHKAIAILLEALELTDDPLYLHTLLGVEYLFIEEYEKAKQRFMKCVDIDESDYAALCNIMCCFDFLEDHEGAIHYLNDYLEHNPYCEIAWHQLGKMYYALEQYEETLKAFDFAIISDDTFTSAYFDKGRVLEKLEQYEEAIQNYETTLTLEDSTAYAHLRIGRCYEKMSKHDLAKYYYNNAIHEDPELDKAWLAITDFHYGLKEYSEALFHIEKAISLDEENPHYWKKAADIHGALQQWKKAALAYEKAIALGNRDADTWQQWADVLKNKGDSSASIRVLQQGIEVHPENIDLIFKLAQLYLSNDQNTLAKKQVIKAAEVTLKILRSFEKKTPDPDTIVWLQTLIANLKGKRS